MNTLRDLLDLAIEQEVNSQKLYSRGQEIAKDDEVKKFFSRLVKEEQTHEKILYNILATEIYELDTPIDDASLFETARSSHGDNTAAFDPHWGVEEIMEIALKREYNARKRYEAAARSTNDQELITFFSKLAEEETLHHKVIDKEFRLLKGLMGKEF